MTINISIKEPLESKLNKAFTKLVTKNKFISNDKNEFILTLLDSGIADLYKSKMILFLYNRSVPLFSHYKIH